jgi:Rieske Fe-S protein
MEREDPEQLTTYPNGRPAAEQAAWRKDFPVDWPQDNYVARRDFVKFLLLTSFAFVVGQFWIGALNFLRRRTGQLEIQRIASAASVPIGGAVQFNYPGEHDPCLLLRIDENNFVAYGQKCTHLSCAVIPDLANKRIVCPCHKGIFDAGTGRPLAGPPRRPLPRITLLNQNGELYATGVEVSA